MKTNYEKIIINRSDVSWCAFFCARNSLWSCWWIKRNQFQKQLEQQNVHTKVKNGGYFGGYASKNVSNGHEVFGELLFTTIGTKFIDNEGVNMKIFQ